MLENAYKTSNHKPINYRKSVSTPFPASVPENGKLVIDESMTHMIHVTGLHVFSVGVACANCNGLKATLL